MAPIIFIGSSCINRCIVGDSSAKLTTGTIYPTSEGINATKAFGLAAEISNALVAVTKAAPHPNSPHKMSAPPIERLYGDKVQCATN